MSVSNDYVIIGAKDAGTENQGVVFFFNDDPINPSPLNAINGPTSDSPTGASIDFGLSVSLSGNTALIGDSRYNSQAGAVYYIPDVTTGSKTLLTAPTPTANELFGSSVSLSGIHAIVGASGHSDNGFDGCGAFYYYSDISTPSPVLIVNPDQSVENTSFGSLVALSDGGAVISGQNYTVNGTKVGAAYYYTVNSLEGAGVTTPYPARLVAAEDLSQTGTLASYSVAISGTNVLVDRVEATMNGKQSGAVYYYDMSAFAGSGSTQSFVQTSILYPSDGADGDYFGASIAISGNSALIGAINAKNDGGDPAGAVYYFTNVQSQTTETLRIQSPTARLNSKFGSSVSLSGDHFAISSPGEGNGRIYTGYIDSMTTLDKGNTDRIIENLSFISHTDWIVGYTSSTNTVGLYGGTATLGIGYSLYIGKYDGSDNNVLNVGSGAYLNIGEIYIGTANNSGNALLLGAYGLISGVSSIHLAGDNSLILTGDYHSWADFSSFLGTTSLYMSGTEVTEANYASLVSITYDNLSYTTVTSVPEPATVAFFFGTAALAFPFLRRKKTALMK